MNFFLKLKIISILKNVKIEVEKVFLRKSSDLSRFLHDMYSEIEEYEDFKFLSRQDFCYLINYFRNNSNRDVDINIVLEKIWNHFDFGENQEVFLIKLKLNKLINNFEGNHRLRKKFIFNNMELIPNHSEIDKKILDVIEKENLRNRFLHDSDEDILFDANEFACKNQDLDLKFVSADNNFIKAIDILIDYLCIDEGVNLFDFSNFN